MRSPSGSNRGEFETICLFRGCLLVVITHAVVTSPFSYPYITHLYLNAGVGAWAGINWMAAFIEVFCEPMKALTDPEFKKQHTGWRSDKDKLGWVWQCNVFGHWCLVGAS